MQMKCAIILILSILASTTSFADTEKYTHGKQLIACFFHHHERLLNANLHKGTDYNCVNTTEHGNNTYISNITQQHRSLMSSKQILQVTVNNRQHETAVLQRYQRSGLHANWKKIGTLIPIVIGKNGLAKQVSDPSSIAFPIKKEGDLRTPLGIFPISFSFGIMSADKNISSLPWQQLTSDIECVDDPNSRYYNRIVNHRNIISSDWRSSEKMMQEPLYKLGAFIAYNTQPTYPGAGSCIFLHVWRNARTGTAGCLAMDEKNLRVVLKWLRLNDSPLIVIGEIVI